MHTIQRRIVMAALMIGIAASLSACMTTSQDVDPMVTGSLPGVQESLPSIKETALLGRKWQKDPGNVRVGLEYAADLERLGETREQLAVLEVLVKHHPRDARLRMLQGKALLAGGRPVQAERAFRTAVSLGQRDWKVHNALGSALAAQGRYAEARAEYARALTLSPDNPKIVNNVAMSHILEGNPKKAETLLRTALKKTDQDSPEARRLRQNLSLAVGLQGRFDEARYIASQDLSPEQVEANMAYIRRMLGATGTWDQLKKG